MPFINLIQEQRLAARRNEGKARSFLFMFIGATLASVAGYGALSYQTVALKAEEAALQSSIQKVAPMLAQIEATDRDYQRLMPRLKTLQDAQTVSDRWNRIMVHISRNTPADTWLTAMRSVAEPDKPISLSFVGIAKAQEPVAEFILRLQNSKDLEAVNLKYTQEKVVSMSKGTEFEVSGEIAGTGEERLKDESKESK